VSAAPRLRLGLLTCALAAALGLAPATARAEFSLDVRTDRTSLSLDDVLTLQITVQAQGESPEIQLPTFDGFQVVSQQVQKPMQFSFSFGAQAVVQSSTIYIFGLQPVRAGTLMIKPVRVQQGGRTQSSRPITISVTGGTAPQTRPGQPQQQSEPNATQPNEPGGGEVDPVAFVRTVVDKPEPYEGEQVTITIYLYLRERLASTPNVETEPTTDGLWIQDLLPPGHNLQPGRQVVGNALYAVYVLKRVAGFPLRSGDITIGPMSLVIDTSSLFDIFQPNQVRPNTKRSSQPVVLHVKPLPEAGRPPGEVAVGRFTLATKLDRTQAVTGDAVTLTATVQGQGNLRGVKLQAPVLPGVDVLAPETKDLIEWPNDLVGGTREYRFLLVPRTPGRLQIPALSLSAFDPATQRYERASSQPLSLEVVGQALAKPQQNAEPAPEQKRPSEPQTSWAPIRTQSELRRGYSRLVEEPWYPWAVAAPFALWLSVVSAAAMRRRLAAASQSGKGRLFREAEQRLRNAESAAKEGAAPRFFAEASAALIAVLEARFEETLTGLTRPELRARLEARGVRAELTQATLAQLDRADLARFAGAAGGNVTELTNEAVKLRELYAKLEAAAPRGAEEAA